MAVKHDQTSDLYNTLMIFAAIIGFVLIILIVIIVWNKKLKKEFLNHDIFILPSLVEPWGLVVEEAFYFGLPVIISQKCGARDIVKSGINGYWVDPQNVDELVSLIQKIDSNKYCELITGVEKFSLNAKDIEQIEVYL